MCLNQYQCCPYFKVNIYKKKTCQATFQEKNNYRNFKFKAVNKYQESKMLCQQRFLKWALKLLIRYIETKLNINKLVDS